jgi:hypothetical protein
LRGGGGAGFDYADVSNASAATTRAFASDAPKYRVATNGFNNEGKCTNKHCDGYDHWVIMKKGYGTFDIIGEDHMNKCPLCDKYVKGGRSGFANCKYMFKGRKFVPGKAIEKYESKWAEVGNQYRLFDPKDTGDAQWLELNVIAKATGDDASEQRTIDQNTKTILQDKIEESIRKFDRAKEKRETNSRNSISSDGNTNSPASTTTKSTKAKTTIGTTDKKKSTKKKPGFFAKLFGCSSK